MATVVHTTVRLLHVLGMAVLVGGGLFTWNALRSKPAGHGPLLRQYEWVFWATMGVMVVTGIGNLGAVGAPGPATRWGTIMTAKLLLVLLFVVGSVLRTFLVIHLDVGIDSPTAAPDDTAPSGSDGAAAATVSTLRRGYLVTVVLLVAIVVAAEVLAHG